jgi:hypothetical protein
VSDGLRALATARDAQQEERARAHADAARAEETARTLWRDATDRVSEARNRLVEAGADGGSSAADRERREAVRARLRDRLRGAERVEASAAAAHADAARALESARVALGTAHGERRVVEVALERGRAEARVRLGRKEEDEADELSRPQRD